MKNETLTILTPDGPRRARLAFIDWHNADKLVVTYELEDCNAIVSPTENIDVVQSEDEEERPRIRTYHFNSAYIRFYHNEEMRTGVITHCTDKAWRIMNKDLGATWVPKNIIRWSEIAGQFCVTEHYEFNFTKAITDEMAAYPLTFNPDEIINKELD